MNSTLNVPTMYIPTMNNFTTNPAIDPAMNVPAMNIPTMNSSTNSTMNFPTMNSATNSSLNPTMNIPTMNSNVSLKPLRGFTLIEILVVISIIVILASIGMVVIPRVQEQARDAKRISDLNNLSSAIENFYADQRRLPGVSGATHYSFTVFGVNFQNCDGSGWIPENICSYLNVLPIDPKNSLDFRYRYLPSGIIYEIDAPMEALTTEAANDGGNDNCGADDCRYEVGTGLTLL